MKKRNIIYVFLIIICLVMYCVPGIGSIVIKTYNDYLDKGIIDGFSGQIELYIVNILIILVCWIVNIVITFSKKNTWKYKYLLFSIIIILSLFISVGSNKYSGGIAGINETEKIYLWNMINYILR